MRRASIWLLRLGAVAFIVFGLLAFLGPATASESFPWKVGPFLAMTIGGWALGTAGFALDAGRDLHPARTWPLVVYLALFGVGQLLVLALFADRLVVQAPLTLPYLLGLMTLAAGAILALVGWLRSRSAVLGSSNGTVRLWMRILAAVFAATVGALAVITAIAGPEGMAARGEVVPEPMTVFTIRAFSAFFVAIAASAVAVAIVRDDRAFTALSRAGLYLIVPITVAAVVNAHLFDAGARPLSFVYLGAYVVVGVLLVARLLVARRARNPALAASA